MKPTNKGLKNTTIKGLLLTIEGKAWHESAKREIPVTTNGKVRFNGKLYDLQKIMIETKSKEPKRPEKKNVSIRELQKQGFRKTKIKGLYITNNGLCYNSVSKRNLAITKGKITINGKAYNIVKVILETFCEISIRSGQIKFKNGNDKDFYFENLDYTTTIKKTAPTKADLIQCIRLYFEVSNKFTTSNILFKSYLQEIASKRGFASLHQDNDFNLFLEWLKPFSYSESKAVISANHNYSIANGTNAINKYLTMLINECLQDEKNEILKIKDFSKKTPTKIEKNKLANETLKNLGFSIQIPLRTNKSQVKIKDQLRTKSNN